MNYNTKLILVGLVAGGTSVANALQASFNTTLTANQWVYTLLLGIISAGTALLAFNDKTQKP